MARGRPTKYTADLAARICVHLVHGATRRLAAEAEGVHEDTLAAWMQRRADFLAAVTQAEAQARTEKLARLELAAQKGSVQAITWLLERLEPQAYAEPPRRVALEGKDGRDILIRVIYDDADAEAAASPRGPEGGPGTGEAL